MADKSRQAGHAHTSYRVVRLLLADRAPAAQRAHQRRHVLRQLSAAGRKPDAAPTLDPAIGIEQATQHVLTDFLARCQIDLGHELLVTAQAGQLQRLQGDTQRIGLCTHQAAHLAAIPAYYTPVASAGMAHDQIVTNARFHARHGFRAGAGKADGSGSSQIAIAQQRAQHPAVNRQLVLMTEVATGAFDPEPVLVTLYLQHVDQAFGGQYTRRFPAAEMHAPQVFGTAFGAAAIRQGHTVDLALALRENAGHHGRRTITRSQRIADFQLIHAFPAPEGAYLRVQRLRLAHGGTCRQNHQIPRLKTRRHPVQIVKSGRYASDVVRVLRHLLDTVQQVNHQRFHRLEAFLHARAFFADLEDLLLGLVQHLFHRHALGIEGARGDFVAGGNQLAQDGALAHDLGVAADVAGARHVLCQLVQIDQAANLAVLAHGLQGLKHGDHVGRARTIDQLADGLEHQLVLVAVEITRHQQVGDTVPGIVVQQQATQHAGFGLVGMRRHAQLADLAINRFVVIVRGGEVIGVLHGVIVHGQPPW